jgi:predicted ATPase/DNA-binding CsgD family transcriptional regulator
LETGGWASPKRDVLNTGRTSKPGSTPQHNLPAQRSSFVGRKREIEEVKRELAVTRLLTLTGVGGSGKSRFALEVARGLIEAYPDGAWLVELAPLSEEVLVPKAVAEALEVPERPQEPLADTLVEVLRDRQLLLVLDNCEHLLEASARLVDKLLDSCPRVRILATSREALGVQGEARRPVPPLSVPEPQGRPSSEDSSSSEGLEGFESVRLFIERARERDPTFSLSLQNAPAVAEICGRLEGIPLAIELAAARVGTLSLEQISERLVGSLELLTRGGRTAVPRQRTLRGTLDWSYDLLSESEQTLFDRLSVFAGGWTLEAASMVAKGEGVEEAEVLDLLSGLVEKSLVMLRGGDPGGARYRLLEPVRQYALDKLEESDEAEEARRRHAEFFLALAEEAYPELKGANQLEWLDRLEAEHDNMRAALSWALERTEAEVAIRLGGSLVWFWSVRGYYSEGRRWLDAALAMDGRGSPASRAGALAGTGGLALDQGDYERAKEAFEEGLQLLSNEGRESSEAKHRLLIWSGHMAWNREEHGQAKQLFEESLALSREMGDTYLLASSLLFLAPVTHALGDSEKATELYEQSIDLFRAHGDNQALAHCLNRLAMLVYSQGDLGRATKLTQEAIVLFRELGTRGHVPLGLCNLGWIALLQDDLGRAADLYRESLSLSWDTGLNPIVQNALEGFACVAGAKGEAERAARLWGAAQALHETKSIFRDANILAEADARISAVRSGMGEEAWEEAWRKGRAMTLEEAVEYALSEDDSSMIASRTPEQTSTTAPRPSALTRREREVAKLVARGLTNRQIAEELVLSGRTVENHVRNILKKLKLSSRSEVAAWVEAQPS